MPPGSPHPALARRAAPGFVLAGLAAALLAACGGGDDDPGPGGVTNGEAKALDEAAEMLDAQRLPEGTLTEAAGAPEASPRVRPAER